MMDLDFLRGLIEAVDESGIDTLEITRAGTKIRISKTPPVGNATAAVSHVPVGAQAALPPPAPPAAGNTGGNPEGAAVEAESPAPEAIEDGLVEVVSPMVGTFYRAPAPEAPPYVEVGSTVGRGQTLCILEAMKLMNELQSEVEGVIREILVENAQPVEYGQALFRVEPVGKSRS